MSTSTNGILAYGYDLGGDEEWKLQDAGEFGEFPDLDWYDPESEDGDDFQTAAETRLLATIAGFTETDWQADGYFDREREAKARLGVEFDTYCSDSYPMFLLATKVITVYRGSTEVIDMADLAAAPAREGWDDKLRAALDALGLKPTQQQAKWLLCSYWG
jgi:hypothetical protein